MQALDAQLESIEQAIGEKQTVVDTAEQKLIEAKKVAEQAARQKAEAEAKAESLKQQIMKLRGAL
jgi:predicted  nucleic acid-binding Zn-ribbon protein